MCPSTIVGVQGPAERAGTAHDMGKHFQSMQEAKPISRSPGAPRLHSHFTSLPTSLFKIPQRVGADVSECAGCLVQCGHRGMCWGCRNACGARPVFLAAGFRLGCTYCFGLDPVFHFLPLPLLLLCTNPLPLLPSLFPCPACPASTLLNKS